MLPEIEPFLNKLSWSEEDVDNLITIVMRNRNACKQYVEFKPGVPLGATVSAFTKSNTGLIIVGINDDGKKEGVTKTDDKSIHQHLCDAYNPPPQDFQIFLVPLRNRPEKIYVVRIVKTGALAPYRGAYYKRSGDRDIALTGDELNIVIAEQDKYDYSLKPIREAEYPAELDEKKYAVLFNYFQEKLSHKLTMSAEDFLNSTCRVLFKREDGQLVFNAAGVLFLAKNPQKFIPNATIRCIKIRGNSYSKEDTKEDMIANGSLLETIDAAFEFVNRNIRIGTKVINARTVPVPEYPFIVFREAIINAVAHRNYFIENLDIKLFIMDDRIEIISPGKFPEGSLEGGIPRKHYPVNAQICTLLHRCGYIDKVGAGVDRIISEIEALGRKSPIFNDKEGVVSKVVLWGELSILEDLSLRFELDSHQKKALEIILTQEFIQTGQYAELTASSRPKARNELNKLVKLKILSKKGRGRASKYILAKNVRLI